MRININVFYILAGFFLLADIAYTVWSLLSGTTNAGGGGKVEWVGTLGIALVAVMSIFIGFYLNRSYRAQGGELPEDRLDASIDDGDPELGFFSPWSWWPIILAASAALAFLGIAIGVWISLIAVGIFVVAIVGWVYEYYRGLFAR
jgi:Cytochrome c oxidase subunit IV